MQKQEQLKEHYKTRYDQYSVVVSLHVGTFRDPFPSCPYHRSLALAELVAFRP